MQQVDPCVDVLQQWMAVFMHRSMHDFAAYARESGLSVPQLGALFQIHHRGCSGVTDLGEKLGVTSSAASQMLERLVHQGLIRRTEDPNDRRVKQVVLTDKGRDVLQLSIHTRQRWLSDLVQALSSEEKEQIIVALNILIDKVTYLGQPAEAGS
jgi:MarR family transcriptional regulator, organic hydroperoxide resistance regulator